MRKLRGIYYKLKENYSTGNGQTWAKGKHHYLVLNLIKNLFRDNSLEKLSVIDIGCGSGDLLKELKEIGFNNLTAVDYDKFLIHKFNFLSRDLNDNWKINNKYDLVILKEVIEHLENPRYTIREVKKILNKNGICIISFPNIFYWRGRLKFLLGKNIYGYDDDDYKLAGHITPVTYYNIERICKEEGLSCKIIFEKNRLLSQNTLVTITRELNDTIRDL